MNAALASELRTTEIDNALSYLGFYGRQMLCVPAGTDCSSRQRYTAMMGADWPALAEGNGARELFDLDLIEADVTGRYPIKLNARGQAVIADWIASR